MIGEEEKGNTTEAGGVIEVTGLSPETTYQNVRVRAYDNAGNYKDTFGVTVTTLEELKAPVITILNNNTWAREKTAQIQGVEGYTIRYTLDGTDPTATTGTSLTGTGTHEIALETEECIVKAIYVSNKDTTRVTKVGVSDKAKIDSTPPSNVVLSIVKTEYNRVTLSCAAEENLSDITDFSFYNGSVKLYCADDFEKISRFYYVYSVFYVGLQIFWIIFNQLCRD